ncbi:MAG: hypothetical protein PHN89_05665 [Candidatus Pacebacteria bacterium]|nr:hypothetical protein [Candidatus Paceibacterota bacterium]
MANKIFAAGGEAVSTSGFQKAFFFSFGSWLAGWGIAWLAGSQAAQYLGEYGWVVPLLNTIAVFAKQWFDSYTTPQV